MSMSTEKKVGIFFLLTMIALGFMIELVEDWNPFESRHNYRAYFESASGIKVGDPVRMAGVEVGKIRSIGLEKGRVRVDFYVVDGTRIREDSTAQARQTNFLGGQYLGLDFGSENRPLLPPGSAVPTRESASIEQLIANLDRNQERVLGELGSLIEETRGPLERTVSSMETVVRRIEQGEGTLGRIVNDPALYDDLQQAVAHIRGIASQMEKGEGTLGRLLKDPALYDDARVTVANLRLLSERVREGQGTVGRLFNDEVLYSNASDALANIRDISHKANNGTGSLGKLVNDEELYREFSGSMARINSIAGKIDDGQGTIGRLVNEDDLYRDAKTTLNKVEKTVDGMSDSGPLSALGVVLGTMF